MNSLPHLLKTKKMRLTKAREDIFQILTKSDKALSPKVIQKELLGQGKTADLVSIYRNLSLFSELGIAHKFIDGRFAICKHEHEEHSHMHLLMSCSDCGRVEEVQSHSQSICKSAETLKLLATELKSVDSIMLRGRCGDCLPG